MTILYLKLAFIKKRTSPRIFVHDGFLPIMFNPNEFKGVITSGIKRLCPQLNSKTRIFVIDQEDDEIIFWPHLDGQVNELAAWLAMNYSDKDRIKIYIEQLPIDGKDINSESVDDLIVSNPIPGFESSINHCIKCITEGQGKLGERIKQLENSVQCLSTSVEYLTKLQISKRLENTLHE